MQWPTNHCMLQIWVSILGLDLGKRRAIRSGAPQLAGADLKSLLADPFVMHIAGASCESCLLCNAMQCTSHAALSSPASKRLASVATVELLHTMSKCGGVY